MQENKWGRLITITSSAVKQPVEGLLLSNSIRAAVTGLARTLANEYGADGITVNNVCPGFTRTARLDNLAAASPSVPARSLKKFSPAGSANSGRPRGHSGRIAAVVTFLASERASYINGTSIAVDGGLVRVSSSSQCPSPPATSNSLFCRTFRDFAARCRCADSRMGNARPLLLRHAHWR